MQVFCVKDKLKTPNVPGSEKILTTKNNRKRLEAKCTVCGNKKSQFLSLKQALALEQQDYGVLDKPLEVAKFAETLTKKCYLPQNLYLIGIGKVILRKLLSLDQLVSQARNFGLIQKKVLSCVW